MATVGTQRFLANKGLEVEPIRKVLEGRPHCVDALLNGEINLVINTTEGVQAIADSFSIRRTAISVNVPHYTTLSGASAVVDGIEALREEGLEVVPLQAYFN